MATAQTRPRQDRDTTEFVFTSDDFRAIADLVYRHSGIVLGANKESMVYARLSRRLRELGLTRFDEYCELLQNSDRTDEFLNFSNAMTTNLTRFFRERHHFDYLTNTIVPELRRSDSGRIRIWSAGCSSGEEPYSIAMTLRESLSDLDRWDAKILATDLDTNVLLKAANGTYPFDTIDEIPKDAAYRYFDRTPTGAKAKNSLRELIAFKPLNLLDEWPVSGPFDVIFCRNVMIYFDNSTKNELVQRFSTLLKPGGWLIVGHSETLLDQQRFFKLCGRTIYRKLGGLSS